MKSFYIYVYDNSVYQRLSEKLKMNINKFVTEINFTTRKVKYNHNKTQQTDEYYKKKLRKYNQNVFNKMKMKKYFSRKNYNIISKIFAIYDPDKITIKEISDILGKNITDKTIYLYLPESKDEVVSNITDVALGNCNIKNPIYIVSRGRYNIKGTANLFLKMGIDNFKVVVEEQEYELYNRILDEDNLLILDNKFKENYNLLDPFDDDKTKTGPGASRNFVWENAIQNGFDFHWVFDDNIQEFLYYNNNKIYSIFDQNLFGQFERFITETTNIGMAGFLDKGFIVYKSFTTPYILNSRIYSMNLIRNSVKSRWRGRYNEDSILSIDILKEGYLTFLTKFILGSKTTSQKLGGGNTDIFYTKGTLLKSGLLFWNYPEQTELVFRFNRWHHQVKYQNYNLNKKIEYKDNFAPLTNKESEIYLKKYDITSETNIIAIYDKLQMKLPEYINKEKLERKLEKYKNGYNYHKENNPNKVEVFVNKKVNDKYFGFILYKEDELEKKYLVLGDDIEQNLENYRIIEKKIDKLIEKKKIGIYNLNQTDIDALVALYGAKNNISIIDKYYVISSKKKLEDLIKEMDMIIVIQNKEIPKYIEQFLVKYKDKIKIISAKNRKKLQFFT